MYENRRIKSHCFKNYFVLIYDCKIVLWAKHCKWVKFSLCTPYFWHSAKLSIVNDDKIIIRLYIIIFVRYLFNYCTYFM